jgi:hypothetical protein
MKSVLSDLSNLTTERKKYAEQILSETSSEGRSSVEFASDVKTQMCKKFPEISGFGSQTKRTIYKTATEVYRQRGQDSIESIRESNKASSEFYSKRQTEYVDKYGSC